jgi:hypothetical protein
LNAYDQALAIETAFFERLRRHASADPVARLVPLAEDPTDIAGQYGSLRAWFLDRDGEGHTMMERWERAGFQGLNNDQRVLARGHAKVRVMVLETLDHVSRDALRVRDRLNLDAPPIVVQDRAMAKRSGRFSRLVAWTYPLPQYFRVTTSAFSVPDVGSLEAEEIVGAVAAHLRGASAGEPLREWLSANYGVMSVALESVQEALRRKAFEDVTYTKTFYRVEGPVQGLIDVLAKAPEAVAQAPSAADGKEGITHEWTWLDTDAEAQRKAPPGGRPTLGRVLLGAGKVRLEGGGEDRARRLREGFERSAGSRVAFEGRRVDDLGKQLIARDSTPCDMSLVPPRLLEFAPRLESSMHLMSETMAAKAADDLMREARRRWVDEPIPALEGKTPRQAANDPVLRPKVAALVKEQIRRADRAVIEKERFEDEGWLAVELGLTELQLPVPPRLAELAAKGGGGRRDRADDDHSYRDDEDEDDLPHPDADGESFGEALQAFRAHCPDLEEWIEGATGSLNDREHSAILSLVAMAWTAATDGGKRALALNFDRLNHQLKAIMSAVVARPAEGSDPITVLLPSQEDEMACTLCAMLATVSELAPEPPADPIGQEALFLGIFIIRAVTQELDRAGAEG